MSYCVAADLLLGDLQIPSTVNVDKWITDAADEIDSRIAFRYVTPVVASDAIATQRATALTLKRINARLASGRLILMLAAPSERANLHAYGQSLVHEALSELAMIVDGSLPLPDVAVITDGIDDLRDDGPALGQQDASSGVEAFYGATMARGYIGEPLFGPAWRPGS